MMRLATDRALAPIAVLFVLAVGVGYGLYAMHFVISGSDARARMTVRAFIPDSHKFVNEHALIFTIFFLLIKIGFSLK